MSAARLTAADADRLHECVTGGGVAVFPTDTVYGVCCNPEIERAVTTLYELKGYPTVLPPARPAAVMFFALEAALAALSDLRSAERAALQALLPGPVTLLLENRARRFALACGPDVATVGLRVPCLPDALTALGSVAVPVMQSSANLRGQHEARTLGEVPMAIREGADMVLDGGELVGRPSTVIDLRDYAGAGCWQILREGALAREAVERMLVSAR
jgi:L-threonylcarbamoyladenylate synthase